MYKIAGVICIVAGCIGWGSGKVRQEKERVWHLRELLRILRRMQEEIDYGKRTLPEICLILADSCNACYSPCFERIYEQTTMGNGTGLKEAWETQMEACMKELPLKREEKDVIIDLPLYLGLQEEKSQAGGLGHSVERLSVKCRQAEETYENKVKVIRSVSVLTGLLLSILLL